MKEIKITGMDISEIEMLHELSSFELCVALGITGNTLKKIVGRQDCLKEPTLAILVRLYLENPDLFSRPITAIEFYERLVEVNPSVSKGDFVLTLGRELSAATRWFSGKASGTSVDLILTNAMKVANGDILKAWDIIVRLSSKESSSRGASPATNRTWKVIED